MGFSFQLTAAANSIRISIEQQFKHDIGGILWTANLVRFYLDAQFIKIRRIDKYVISSDRCILGNIFIDTLREKCFLFSVSISICHKKSSHLGEYIITYRQKNKIVFNS